MLELCWLGWVVKLQAGRLRSAFRSETTSKWGRVRGEYAVWRPVRADVPGTLIFEPAASLLSAPLRPVAVLVGVAVHRSSRLQ